MEIIGIGGGKGGAGKSVISANLSVALAQAGKRTALVDVDLGGANLHTLFGLNNLDRGVGDFLYNNGPEELEYYATATGIANLWLISGNGFIPGIANVEYGRKIKLLKALMHLPYDYVVLDVGAGTSYNVIDFFSITQNSIIVTLPEPTAVLNGYEFLKNVLFRAMSLQFRKNKPVINLLEKARTNSGGSDGMGQSMQEFHQTLVKLDANAAQQCKQILQNFRPALVLNRSDNKAAMLAQNLIQICRNYLSIELHFLGSVPNDPRVAQATLRMKPFLLAHPDISASLALRDVAGQCVKRSWLDADTVDLLESSGDDDWGGNVFNVGSHDDRQLSGLMADFFRSSGELVTPVLASDPQAAVVAAPAVAAVVGADPMAAGIDLHLEPRLPEDTLLPTFLLETDLPSPSTWWFRAWLCKQARQEKRAIAFLGKLLAEANPVELEAKFKLLKSSAPRSTNMGYAWLHAGLSFVQTGEIGMARRTFSQALECLPDVPLVQNNWAASWILTSRLNVLPPMLLAELDNRPDSGWLWHNLGLVYLKLKRYSKAANAFERAQTLLKQTPPENIAHLVAAALFATGDYHGAGDFYEQQIGAGGTPTADQWFNAGLALLRQGDYPQAVARLLSCLDLAPDDAEALAARAIAFSRSNNPERSLDDLNDAIRLAPENLAYRQARGTLCFQMGRFDIALRDMETITRLVPGNDTFRQLLTVIRQSLAGVQ